MVVKEKRYWLGKRRPHKLNRPPGVKSHRPPGVSIQPLPDPETLVLTSIDNGEYAIIGQGDEVALEKHMISDETNIPASLGNKVTKIWTDVKNALHKNPPTAITSTTTRSGELSNRNLKKVNYPGIAFMLFIVWLVYKTLKVK